MTHTLRLVPRSYGQRPNFDRRQARPLPGLTVVGTKRDARRKRAVQRIAAGTWRAGWRR